MPHPSARLLPALAATLFLACGGQTSSTTGDASGDVGANTGGANTTSPPTGSAGTSASAGNGASAGTGASTGTAGAPGSIPPTGPTWSAPPSPPADVCLPRADAVATRTSGVHTCSTVVRLDYQTLEPLLYGPLCDPYAAVDEASARQKAEGYMIHVDGPTMAVTEPGATDLFVYRRDGSYERRLIAVSARHGGFVFGAITGNYGPVSDMLFPLVYAEGEALGLGCVPKTPRPSARGFDLVNGGPLPPDRVQAAIDAVWHTAVPEGLSQGGYVFDAMVLLTQPDFDRFEPARARYTVIVNSGWLE